ncbi:MAG: chitobiase/beta-hexosaminidase C-terminal domain-containing protein [Muribaculaceae bacterium]|nr:chitobiase/beta-hexosaminidase C-terminal domain-containing protein [Muribaculaceae bacterium]
MASRTVTLSCATEGAEISYRIGVAGEWTAYTAPFTVGRNCTVYAKAVFDGYNDSEIAEIPVTGFPDSMPQPIITFSDGMVTMMCERSDAEIRYTLDGTVPTMESTLYEGPFPLSHNATVWAFAYIPDSDIEPSEISELVVDSYRSAPVAISYNGRYVTMNTDDPQAEIRYSIILPDGVVSVEDAPYTGEFDVNTLCHVRAKTIREGYQDSEEFDYAIDYYGDESHAETNAGGLLKSCYDWCDSELLNGIHEFSVEGTLNDDDYSFLKSMEGLRHLDIEKVAAARIPDNAFKGTRLISISMPADITEYGDSILSDCDRLSGVIWNSKMMDIESRLIDGISNPNVLLYVSSEVKVENQDNHNVIVDDVASSVILHDEYPFDVAREFMAEKISFTRNFDMETLINGCSGWESIVLPFSPDSIVHERAGRIVPFKAWEEDEFADFKPFWLYKSNSSCWEEVESMEACVPYIISMPNNEAYVRDFNIAGNVSFVASLVTLTPESVSPESTPWVDGTQFIGTFMPVEESGVRSLNVNGEDDRTPGSAFVEEATTKPFGAYIAGAHRRYMPVFESSGALLLPSLGSDGLKVYSPAPGTLKISSNCRRKVSLTTITGVNLRTILLSAGETVTIEGLTRDIYMVGGIKVTVR